MNDVDKQILGALTSTERIQALLRVAGFPTYREFAIKVGRYREEVSMCFRGTRPYPEIRDAAAKECGVSREEIDRLIDAPAQARAS